MPASVLAMEALYFCSMYSRQESAQLKQQFWTAFGQYMNPVFSADGEKQNWVNYRTGEKDIAFRMTADNRKASISIELSHRDEGIRQLYFDQFLQFRSLLTEALQEEWNWALQSFNETGRPVATISATLPGVSIFRKEDWPQIISFFKPRIMALDEFWSGVKYAFAALR